MTQRLVENYMRNLVGLFYKILPMWEDNIPTLPTYIEELKDELMSCDKLMDACGYDGRFLTLIATLQSFLDAPDMDLTHVKRRVFGSIKTIESLCDQYCEEAK